MTFRRGHETTRSVARGDRTHMSQEGGGAQILQLTLDTAKRDGWSGSSLNSVAKPIRERPCGSIPICTGY